MCDDTETCEPIELGEYTLNVLRYEGSESVKADLFRDDDWLAAWGSQPSVEFLLEDVARWLEGVSRSTAEAATVARGMSRARPTKD
jgi:hypothetical protein